MRHLVRDQVVRSLGPLPCKIGGNQIARGERCRAHILHAGLHEFVHRRLSVLVPRIRNSKSIRKEIEHLFGVAERRINRIFHPARYVVVNRDVAPDVLFFLVLSGHE